MITAFNALLECFVTGLVAGLTIYFLARIGALPILVMMEEKEAEEK